MNPLKILIVEDEALLAMELEDIVTDAGHTVVGCAVSRADALHLADTTDADVALVDIHLSEVRQASRSPSTSAAGIARWSYS